MERDVTMEKNARQSMLFMTIDGMRNSRWTSFIIVLLLVVVDNFKRMAILVFMHSSSFTKRTFLMRIRNVSLTRDITARMLQRPV